MTDQTSAEIVRRLRDQGKDAFAKQYSLGMWKLCDEAASLIESLSAEKARLVEWQRSVLSKCKHCDGWEAMSWGGDKDGWGFVHYFIGHLNTRALAAESTVARLTGEKNDPVGGSSVRDERS